MVRAELGQCLVDAGFAVPAVSGHGPWNTAGAALTRWITGPIVVRQSGRTQQIMKLPGHRPPRLRHQPAAWSSRTARPVMVALHRGLTRLMAAVAGRCDGVPFYVEQIVNGRSETVVPVLTPAEW